MLDDEDEMMDCHEICYRYSFPSQDGFCPIHWFEM